MTLTVAHRDSESGAWAATVSTAGTVVALFGWLHTTKATTTKDQATTTTTTTTTARQSTAAVTVSNKPQSLVLARRPPPRLHGDFVPLLRRWPRLKQQQPQQQQQQLSRLVVAELQQQQQEQQLRLPDAQQERQQQERQQARQQADGEELWWRTRRRGRRRAPPRRQLCALRNAFLLYLALCALSLKCAVLICDAFSIRDVIRVSGKRTTTALDVVICPTWHPFQCPNGECIPIKYLCDGSPDCSDEYDEDRRMCTAAVRPPVEETAAFLKALLSAHGADFLVKLFGPKARDAMREMGGVERVAVAISQSPTIETFGAELGLRAGEVQQLSALLDAIVAGETSELTPEEASDFRFFVQKLQETGFF